MIPEAALEAAAWAIYEIQFPIHKATSFEQVGGPIQEACMAEARNILEAAAPHMLADIAAELEDAPPANYEEDNYDAGYAAGLAFALDSLGAAK